MAAPPSTSIGDRIIGPEHPPFIVAEMSGNHDGSLEKALAIVDAAAETGVDAIKLQTSPADTMTIAHEGPGFRIDDPDSLWFGKTLYALYGEAHTPWDWHAPIMERCKERGLLCFSTPFDESAVRFLQDLEVPAFKIASFENVDLELLGQVAQPRKPGILSTGLATLEELDQAVSALRDNGCQDLILLKCTSAYPAPPEAANLRAMNALREQCDALVGLSDHTLGSTVAIAAVSLGGCFVEKHFTLDRAAGGVDSAFSLEPDEMAELVSACRTAWSSLGSSRLGPVDAERGSLVFRRSLYVLEDIEAGARFTPENVRSIRPGFGLPPGDLPKVLGKRAARKIERGTPLNWSLIRD